MVTWASFEDFGNVPKKLELIITLELIDPERSNQHGTLDFDHIYTIKKKKNEKSHSCRFCAIRKIGGFSWVFMGFHGPHKG